MTLTTKVWICRHIRGIGSSLNEELKAYMSHKKLKLYHAHGKLHLLSASFSDMLSFPLCQWRTALLIVCSKPVCAWEHVYLALWGLYPPARLLVVWEEDCAEWNPCMNDKCKTFSATGFLKAR